MADAVIKQAAIERSMDNLTIVIISFENLQEFLNDRPAPKQLEQHLFQIKEIDSGTTSCAYKDGPAPSSNQEGLNANKQEKEFDGQIFSPSKVQ